MGKQKAAPAVRQRQENEFRSRTRKSSGETEALPLQLRVDYFAAAALAYLRHLPSQEMASWLHVPRGRIVPASNLRDVRIPRRGRLGGHAEIREYRHGNHGARVLDLCAFAVSRSAGVTLVQFKEGRTFEEETVSELRDDFAQLADSLGRDSKVLLDFTGVESFSSDAIDALVLFNQKLQTKGSRLGAVLPGPRDVRRIFFRRPLTMNLEEYSDAHVHSSALAV